MNALKIYRDAEWALEHNKITLGEFDERIKPLADVEAVVRCKDCTYREACDEGYAEPLIVDGLIWCELHEISREPDYFCADGRRKDS